MIALVRSLSPSFDRALVRSPARARPDAGAALREHAAYLEALRGAGAEVRALPELPQAPDGCFVEDILVVAGRTALITRPGAPSRRSEIEGLVQALPPFLRTVRMTAPATLDGGDVLQLGSVLFVGRSGRTNAAGIRALREAFAPEGLQVREVDVRDALHLKCHASPLGPELLLLTEGFVDPRVFEDQGEIIRVAPAEAYAANAVRIGGSALIAEGFPGVLASVQSLGLTPIPLPTQHIARADGSLTCLSVRISCPD